VKCAKIDIDAIDERCNLQQNRSTNLNDNRNKKQWDNPIHPDCTMVGNGIGNFSDSNGNTEENCWDEPACDVEGDEGYSTEREVPTYLTVKIDCSADNCD
jgi:hypothetical protein